MKIIGITRVKDEIDVLPYVLELLQHEVDGFVLCDNNSTDGTREFLYAFQDICPLPVVVVDDPEVGYYQSRKMTDLAARAAAEGAEWVIPFDADEIWATDGRIADALGALPPEVLVVEASLHDHVATALDPDLKNPVARIGWRRTQQAPLRKVAIRAADHQGPLGFVIHQGNHGASFPGVLHPPAVTNLLEVRHFPYRSAEQFIRKARNGAAAYAATDLPEDAGAHWRGYGRILDESGPDALAGVFREWFWSAQPQLENLVLDPAPR